MKSRTEFPAAVGLASEANSVSTTVGCLIRKVSGLRVWGAGCLIGIGFRLWGLRWRVLNWSTLFFLQRGYMTV